MSNTNLETVRQIYAAFGKQDVPAILERLSDDIQWEYAFPSRGIPWLEPRHGRAGAAGFFESLRNLDIQRFEVNALLGEGKLVVALIDIEFVVLATGKRVVEKDEVHLWHFDDRGRVARMRHAADTLQHAAAMKP